MVITNRKMTENPVVQRILGLLREQGKLDKDLTDFLGVAPTAMTKWKYDGSKVYLKYIEAICEYLDTTPNYLFWGHEGVSVENGLTSTERELIEKYRNLDNKGKKFVKDMLSYISDAVELAR